MAKNKTGEDKHPRPKFKVGDVVRFDTKKGPDMKVKTVHGGPPSDASKEEALTYGLEYPAFTPYTYTCQWFVGSNLREGTFPEESLERGNGAS